MPLVKGVIAGKMRIFITALNQTEQKDLNAAISRFAEEIETDIYTAIKSATIVIPPGMILVAGPGGASTNPAPIILQSAIQ